MLFKFGFDFFQTFCKSGVFYYFLFFFHGNSGVFLDNRVALPGQTLCTGMLRCGTDRMN